MRILAVLLIGTCFTGVAMAAIQADETANLTFSRDPSLRRMAEHVHIGFLRRDPETGAQILWARHTLRKYDQQPIVGWTDSKSCPALIAAMRKLRDIEMPRPLPLGIEGEQTDITLDGSTYRLKAQASYRRSGAQLELMSNVGTPLAQWVDQSLEALESCWKPTEPSKSQPSS